MTTRSPLTEDEIRAMRNAALGADGHEWYDDLYRSFEAECTPKRVISLLDEVERLRRHCLTRCVPEEVEKLRRADLARPAGGLTVEQALKEMRDMSCIREAWITSEGCLDDNGIVTGALIRVALTTGEKQTFEGPLPELMSQVRSWKQTVEKKGS